MFTCRLSFVNLELMTATCFEENVVATEGVIATFGAAALVEQPEGGYTLAGGSFDDRIEAQEWISLFMHEAVLCG